jgi:hypothetical protein
LRESAIWRGLTNTRRGTSKGLCAPTQNACLKSPWVYSEAAAALSAFFLRGTLGPSLAKVWDTISGNAIVASQLTLTGVASRRILPQLIASSVGAREKERERERETQTGHRKRWRGEGVSKPRRGSKHGKRVARTSTRGARLKSGTNPLFFQDLGARRRRSRRKHARC